MKFTDWLFETGYGITTLLALVAAGVAGLAVAAVQIDSAYREAHRDEWIVACRERCSALSAPAWSYNYRNGCTCGARP